MGTTNSLAPSWMFLSRAAAGLASALLAGAWWDLPREELAPLIPLLQSNRIPELLAALAALRGTKAG